jgi:hypothetical protein
VWFV